MSKVLCNDEGYANFPYEIPDEELILKDMVGSTAATSSRFDLLRN